MPQDRIEFVDSISATATVRMSLSVEPWRVLLDGTDVGPPPFVRSVVSTLLVDGGVIPAAAYDNRVIRLHLQLRSRQPEVLAAQAQRLHRELNRERNFLRWQPDVNIQPVYFRTYRAPEYSSRVDWGIGLYEFQVEIPAEPFALGHRVDYNGGAAIVVSNDPGAGSNPKYFDLTGIQGDVETPLILKTIGSETYNRQTAFGVRRRGSLTGIPISVQAEAFTLSTDATLAANSATYAGAGSNSVTVTPGTTGMVERITTGTGVIPATASVDIRGTYRVFVRAKANTSGNWTLQLQHGGNIIQNNESTSLNYSSLSGQPSMVDLGLVSIPEGYDPVTDGPSGVEIPTTGVQLAVQASRTSGTGTLSLDYLFFVPADDQFAIVSWGGTVIPNPDRIVADGYTRTIYSLNASGQIMDATITASMVGDFLKVLPGVTNRIVAIRDVTPNPGLTDPVSTTWSVYVSYYPRYLMVRPVSS